jgi:hypothetical protein
MNDTLRPSKIGILAVMGFLLPVCFARAEDAPAAVPAAAPASEPVVRLKAGDAIVYSFAQFSRNRFGGGSDQVSEERSLAGTLTVYAIETSKDGGWRVAILSDLDDVFLKKSPGAAEPRPVKKKWRDATIVMLDHNLQRAEGFDVGRAPAVGSSTGDLGEDSPPPPAVPTLFPPLLMKDLSRQEPWNSVITVLAPFGGLCAGNADQGIDRPQDRPGTVLFTRMISGEPTRYIEKFLLDIEGRKLLACEILYHTCGASGNSRQETTAAEKSRRTLDPKELAEIAEAAAEIESTAKLLRDRPAEARKKLEALKARLPSSPFAPAIDAAIGNLRTKSGEN